MPSIPIEVGHNRAASWTLLCQETLLEPHPNLPAFPARLFPIDSFFSPLPLCVLFSLLGFLIVVATTTPSFVIFQKITLLFVEALHLRSKTFLLKLSQVLKSCWSVLSCAFSHLLHSHPLFLQAALHFLAFSTIAWNVACTGLWNFTGRSWELHLPWCRREAAHRIWLYIH